MGIQLLICWVLAQAAGGRERLLEDTPEEPLRESFSLEAAAGYLDRRAHLAESSCYACHSTFSYLPARSRIDPLADEVMRTRVRLERLMARLNDPRQAPQVKTPHASRVRILAAVELARHDAAASGRLAPITRQSLDAMWTLQRSDGGIDWIRVGEAPQAVDDRWPAAMMALGAAAAPDGYADAEPAKSNLAKLRGWFRANPPQTLHDRGLGLLAQSAIGGILDDSERARDVASILGKQHADGGWSMPDLAPWRRKDGKPLDPERSDGYATAFSAYVLACSGVPPEEAGLQRAVRWIRTRQRESGGWFTQSPFSRNSLAGNTGTSFAVQALAACGEIPPPPVSPERFAEARARAERDLPADEDATQPH